MLSGKKFVIAATIVAVLACGAIIAYFMTRPSVKNPFHALTRLDGVTPPRVVPPAVTAPDSPAPTPTLDSRSPEAPEQIAAVAPPPPAAHARSHL